MATFEELDGLLAEALQCLNDAAGLVRELTQLDGKPSLMHLGHAINEACSVPRALGRALGLLQPFRTFPVSDVAWPTAVSKPSSFAIAVTAPMNFAVSPSDGVAIQTTFAKLRESIKDPDAFVSLVEYLDYETARLAVHRASYHSAIHKRRAFAYEQEVRVLRSREKDFNRADKEPIFRLSNDLPIPWEPESVIESIVVSPFCPAPYRATLQRQLPAGDWGIDQLGRPLSPPDFGMAEHPALEVLRLDHRRRGVAVPSRLVSNRASYCRAACRSP